MELNVPVPLIDTLPLAGSGVRSRRIDDAIKALDDAAAVIGWSHGIERQRLVVGRALYHVLILRRMLGAADVDAAAQCEGRRYSPTPQVLRHRGHRGQIGQ